MYRVGSAGSLHFFWAKLLAILALLVVMVVLSAGPASASGTCQSYSQEPVESVFINGDSLFSYSVMRGSLRDGFSSRSIAVTGYAAVGGHHVVHGSAHVAVNSAAVAAADMFLTDYGVNGWWKSITTWTAEVDKYLRDIRSVNPNIVIVWVEPHAVAEFSDPLYPRVSATIPDRVAYLRALDARGDICLVPWSTYAAANPSVYSTAGGRPDGIHVRDNSPEYADVVFRTVDAIVEPVSVTSGTVFVGRNGRGMPGKDAATGVGYVMYSKRPLMARFGTYYSASHNLVLVQYDPIHKTWQYFNNETIRSFTPVASDFLVAEVDYTRDTVGMFEGQSGVIHGISAGFLSSDLTITPNIWGNRHNRGEFGVTGTYLTR